jgi:hypothetical protein
VTDLSDYAYTLSEEICGGIFMQIDRNALEKLLSLNDRQLLHVINRLAADNGIDLSSFNIDAKSVQSVRQGLASATDSDIERVAKMYEQNRKK